MAQGDRPAEEFEQGVEELIQESDRQLRRSRELLGHLDRALARSERLLKRPRSEVIADLRGERETDPAADEGRYHGGGIVPR